MDLSFKIDQSLQTLTISSIDGRRISLFLSTLNEVGKFLVAKQVVKEEEIVIKTHKT